MQAVNISERQGRIRLVVGVAATAGGLVAGVALIDGGTSAAVALLVAVPLLLWGGSWALGGPARVCQVDAARSVEHPTQMLSVGLGGDPIDEAERVRAVRRRAILVTVGATAVAVAGVAVILVAT